jgi:hypothetical protein
MPERRRRFLAGCGLAALLAGCAAPAPDRAALTQQVAATERAFARTMADRDAAAFASFLADETVFFNAKGPVRGKAAVIADWQRSLPAPMRRSRGRHAGSRGVALRNARAHQRAGLTRLTARWWQASRRSGA